MLLLLLLFLLSVDTGAKLYSSDTFTLDWTAVQQHPCVFIDSDKWATTTQSFSYTHSGPRESGLIGDKVMSRQLVGSLVNLSVNEHPRESIMYLVAMRNNNHWCHSIHNIPTTIQPRLLATFRYSFTRTAQDQRVSSHYKYIHTLCLKSGLSSAVCIHMVHIIRNGPVLLLHIPMNASWRHQKKWRSGKAMLLFFFL